MANSFLELNVDLHLLLWNSFVILGVNYATSYEIVNGKITNKKALWFLRYYCEKVIGEFWTKPIFSCHACMSSVWGSAFFLLFSHHLSVQDGIVHVIALVGLGSILKKYSR